jgi:hypothetical protein
VETITVAASRSSTFSMSDMGMLVGSTIVIVVLAWMVLARLKRSRNEPSA